MYKTYATTKKLLCFKQPLCLPSVFKRLRVLFEDRMSGVNGGCLGNSRDVRHELSTSCIDHSAAFVGKIVCLEISEFEALGLGLVAAEQIKIKQRYVKVEF